jgi:hypothetical protein
LGHLLAALSLAWIIGVTALYYLDQHAPRALLHLLRTAAGDTLLIFQGVPAHLLVLVEALLLLAIVTVLGDSLLHAACVRLSGAAERIAYGGGIGLALLAVLTLLLGLAGLLFSGLFFAMTGVGAAAVVVRLWRARSSFRPAFKARLRVDLLSVGFIAVIAYLVYGGFLMAITPDLMPDSLAYHLAGPHLYVAEHRVFNLVPKYGIWRSEAPSNQEMLYTAALLLRGEDSSLARLLTAGEAVLIVATMAAFARRLLGRFRPGLLAAAAFIAAPTVILELGSGFNDLGVTLFTLLTALTLVRWLPRTISGTRDSRWLLLAGAFAGFTYGFKATGAAAVPIGAAFVVLAHLAPALERNRIRNRLLLGARWGATFTAAAAITAAPWFLKAFAFTRNPVYPLLSTIFPSPYWDAHAEQTMLAQQFNGYGVGRSLLDVVASLANLTFINSKFDGVIGPTFLCLIPIAPLLAWVNRDWLRERGALSAVFALWAFGAALFLVWALLVSEARFAFPALAVLILAAACALGGPAAGWRSWLSTGVAALVLVQAALNAPGSHPWHSDVPAASEVLYWPFTDLGVALGKETPDQFFARNPGADYWNPWTVITYINRHLTGNNVRIYVEGPPVLPYYYLNPTVALTANHDVLFEPTRRVDLYAPDALGQLERAGITHLYVDRQAYEKLQATPLASHLEVLTQTPGPANDYWFTPIRLVQVNY